MEKAPCLILLYSALLSNYGGPDGETASKDIELHSSMDGTNWTLLNGAELGKADGPQLLDLKGVESRLVKLTVKSGHSSSYWMLGEAQVYGLLMGSNLLAAANGGRLTAFTSQRDDASWSAGRLTDGLEHGLGQSWSSAAFPKQPQEFTYSFLNQELHRLNWAVFHNFGEEGGAYSSREIEIYASTNGTEWLSITNGTLAKGEGATALGLGGAPARFAKVVIRGGYSSNYWELGEIELFGEGLRENLLLPANGGRLESATSQYDGTTWATTKLTDGVKRGVGNSWSSSPNPNAPQAFVYTFRDHREALLERIVVENFGDAGANFSKAIEFQGSSDGANWTSFQSAVLTPEEGPQTFDLEGAQCRFLKIIVKSGYGGTTWELGELEAYGKLLNEGVIADPQQVVLLEDAPIRIVLGGGVLSGKTPIYTLLRLPSKGLLSGTPPDLLYTPNPNENGPDSFAFQLSDGETASFPATVSINITPVNDPPTLAPIPDQEVVEKTGAHSIVLDGITVGPAATEGSQQATITAAADKTSLATNFSARLDSTLQKWVLSYTADQAGTTLVSVVVTDNGGAANGGVNAATNQFRLTVLPLRHDNLLASANGGKLESFTSQLDSVIWPAARLTDGSRGGVFGSWASSANPTQPQEFLYSFSQHQMAALNAVILRNFGDSGNFSKDVEIWTSLDKTNWTAAAQSALPPSEQPQTFPLSGALARYLKVVVKSGYRPFFWELGEIELSGTLLPNSTPWQNLISPAAGSRLIGFTEQLNAGWSAANLTDGVRGGEGHSWSSASFPGDPREFIYSLAGGEAQRLSLAVIYNYGGADGAYSARQVEVSSSTDGRFWSPLASGTLAKGEAPQFFDLGGAIGTYVKVAVKAGYASNYWQLGEVEIFGAPARANLLLPLNGGRLESATSQYDATTWPATKLIDGVKRGVGNSWASSANPSVPQVFVFSFQEKREALLDSILIENFGDAAGNFSADVELSSSANGKDWLSITNTILAAAEGPQLFPAPGTRCRYLKLIVKSGYKTEFWELGELEAYGQLLQNPVMAFDQELTVAEDTPKPIALTAKSETGKALTYVVVRGPAKGAIFGAPPELTYIPNQNENGEDSFAFKANDGEVDSSPATVQITITPVNDPPTLDPIPAQVVVQGPEPHSILLSGISPGPEITEGAQQIFITAASDTPAVVSALTSRVDPILQKPILTYTAAQTGQALITVVVMDSGGIADGGVNAVTNKFPVTVTSSRTENLLAPANGGNLEDFTSQLDPVIWGAARLTDGVQKGVYASWASAPNPATPQEFVYSFSQKQVAVLNSITLFNFGDSGNFSQDIAISASLDRTNWAEIARGVLPQSEEARVFDLKGAVARYLKTTVKSGYRSAFWELGEIEVSGRLIGETGLRLDVSLTPTEIRITWLDPMAQLQEANQPSGPWRPVIGAPGSPYSIAPAGTARFFRLQR